MKLRIFVEPQQGASYDQQLAVAQRAENLGFDAFFRSDHFLKMGDVSGSPGPSDSWTILAGISRETTTIRLGTLVNSATFRHPAITAISVANVDAMSNGRVELGLGAGWFDAEHKAYGIEFLPLGERFEVLEEQLAIISGLWSTPNGETFSHQGKHYQLQNSPALPKPVQSSVPIIIGGHGVNKTPMLAAKYATEFNSGLISIEDYTAQCERVRVACTKIGRDPNSLRYSIWQPIVCGANDAEIARRAKAIGRDVAELKINGLCGKPEEIVSRLATWAAAGAQTGYLQILDLDDLEHLDLIGAEVLPNI
jgi:F420-dependent oxidoreductase-like protein